MSLSTPKTVVTLWIWFFCVSWCSFNLQIMWPKCVFTIAKVSSFSWKEVISQNKIHLTAIATKFDTRFIAFPIQISTQPAALAILLHRSWPVRRLRVYRLKGAALLETKWTFQTYHQWSPCVMLSHDYGPNIYQFQSLSINPNVIHQRDEITIKDWLTRVNHHFVFCFFRPQLVTKSIFNTNYPPVTQRPCWTSSTCLLK